MCQLVVIVMMHSFSVMAELNF